MGKQETVKRLATAMSQAAAASTSQSIDLKARKRIEELYTITEEIIEAYNGLSNQLETGLYLKYKQLQNVNKKLQDKLDNHHCANCDCRLIRRRRRRTSLKTKIDDDESENDTRTTSKNPFMIPDIEDTQYFDENEEGQEADEDHDKISMDTVQNPIKSSSNDAESEEESEKDDDIEEDTDGINRLPLALQRALRKKARRNKNAKAYLLQVTRYPALCTYLTDKSRSSFDRRATEKEVRPMIENHFGRHSVHDARVRQRLRDELREVHRSYLRTFMEDPHLIKYTSKTLTPQKPLTIKKSPT